MSDNNVVGHLSCYIMKNLSLAKLHAIYRQEHSRMHKDDRRHTAKAFAIIEEFMPKQSVKTFGKYQFLQFRNELIRRDYARSYCNKLISKVKAVFKWGATYDFCSSEVYQNLRLIELVKYGEAREDIPRKDVEDKVILQTLEYLPPTVRDMVIFQRVTGMRPSEVCRMKVSDIHQIDHNEKSYWVCELKEHKTARFGKQRVIPLNDRAMEIIMPYITERTLESFVFVTECKHSCWTVDHWDRVIAETIQENALPKWTLYQLRHTKGTELVIKEGVEVAAAVLGNSVVVMSKVYDHSNVDKLVRSLSVQNISPK